MLHSELVPDPPPKGIFQRRLMVMLHGLGDSVDGWRWFFGGDEPAVAELSARHTRRTTITSGYSWFDLDNMVPGVQRSRKLLFDLLDDLRAKGLPAEQITFGGFSQGCLMAIEAGLHYPHGWRALSASALEFLSWKNWCGNFPPVARQQRLLMTHGTSDPMVPIDKVRPQIPLLKALACTWNGMNL